MLPKKRRYCHYQLFQDTVANYAERLNPIEVNRLHQLNKLFLSEVELSAKGIIGVDGRRLLCAYRRLLDFLMARRMEMLEEVGETPDPYTNKRIECEISSVESILSGFVNTGDKMTLAVQLQHIMTRVAAGQWHALSDYYGQHRGSAARSKWLLWPTPQANGTL